MAEFSEKKYKVYIACNTYNQAEYITDALDGFCMQRTNFPFVCALIDDASTDGEQDVIRKYLEDNFQLDKATTKEDDEHLLIFAQHKDNPNCFFATVFLRTNHYSLGKSRLPYVLEYYENSKYLAWCEGDDYWTDPYKLQKQVDFLEKNKSYSFVCHRYKIFEQDTQLWHEEPAAYIYKDNQYYIHIDKNLFFKAWLTQLLTSMMRIESFKRANRLPDKTLLKHFRDYHMFYFLLDEGFGASLNENMGVYRWNKGGVIRGLDKLGRIKINLECNKELYIYTKDKRFKPPMLAMAYAYLNNIPMGIDKLKIYKELLSLTDTIKEKTLLTLSFFKILKHFKRFNCKIN